MRTFGIAAFVAFMIDQISKYVVIHMMELARIRSIDVLPPVLNFRYGENRGINFGLGGDMSQWVLIVLALAICAGVTVWLWRSPHGRWAQLSGGMLVGGALANVADRLIYGYVLDFLTDCVLFNGAGQDLENSTVVLADDAIFVEGSKLYVDMSGLDFGPQTFIVVNVDVADCPLS